MVSNGKAMDFYKFDETDLQCKLTTEIFIFNNFRNE